MPTRNINLTPALDAFVAEQLASGSYQNASEVIRAALRLMQERAPDGAQARAAIAALIAESDASADDFEDVADIGAWLDGVEADAAALARAGKR